MTSTPSSNVADETMLRFTRAHLTSPAHRAVHSVLVGAPDDWWRPEEVAAATRLGVPDVDVALRQLAAGGIVEVRSPGGDPRYRWCLDLRSLAEPRPDDEFDIDPVCGMTVPWTSPFVLEDTSGVRRFCSLRCMITARETEHP